MNLCAWYFDGRTAKRHEVALHFEDESIRIQGDGVDRREALRLIQISERLGAGPRLLRFTDDAYCEVRDHAGLEAALRAAGHQPARIEAWQGSWRIAGASLVLVVVAVVFAYLYGLPVAARVLALRMPVVVEQKLSNSTLATLDRLWFSPSKLDEARQRALQEGFERLDFARDGRAATIEFRSGGSLGPNAFALPDGRVVLLDELVKLAGNDDEIYAVLAHEQGHAHFKHGLRMLLQGSVVAAFMTAWIGDVSTLLAVLPTAVLETRYSRTFEAEADAYAAKQLREHGIPPARLADMLERLLKWKADKAGKTGDTKFEDGGFLSSHPATLERIRLLRAMSDRSGHDG